MRVRVQKHLIVVVYRSQQKINVLKKKFQIFIKNMLSKYYGVKHFKSTEQFKFG